MLYIEKEHWNFEVSESLMAESIAHLTSKWALWYTPVTTKVIHNSLGICFCYNDTRHFRKSNVTKKWWKGSCPHYSPSFIQALRFLHLNKIVWHQADKIACRLPEQGYTRCYQSGEVFKTSSYRRDRAIPLTNFQFSFSKHWKLFQPLFFNFIFLF